MFHLIAQQLLNEMEGNQMTTVVHHEMILAYLSLSCTRGGKFKLLKGAPR